VSFSPDGRFLACGGETLTVWNLNTRRRWHVLETSFENETCSAYGALTFQVMFSPDSRYLLRASDLGADVFDTRAGKLMRHFGTHADPSALCAQDGGATLDRVRVERATISPDGQFVLLWGVQRGVALYHWRTGQPLHQFDRGVEVLTDQVYSLTKSWNPPMIPDGTFSPDSRRILLRHADRVLVWDIDTQAAHFTLPVTGNEFARFTPDGAQVVVISTTQTRFYDAEMGMPEDGTLTGAPRYVLRFEGAFYDPQVKAPTRRLFIVDVVTRTEIQVSPDHTKAANIGALSPDGRLLLTGDLGYLVRLFDATTGTHLHDLDLTFP
jgi:WD40 repeat protein